MNKKAQMSGILKIGFGIFLVIFVFLLFYMVLQSRISTLSSRRNFDYYYYSNNFLLALLSEPDCIAIGNYGNESWQVPTQGVLSTKKLDYYHKKNIDLDCLDSYEIIFSLDVRNIPTNETWNLGVQTLDENVYERTIKIPMFVSIMNNEDPANITTAKAILTTYIGELPDFYINLKKSCNLHIEKDYKITTHEKITYSNDKNKLCFGDSCFYPHFTCNVEDFNLTKGTHVVRFSYNKGNLNVLK